MRYIDNHLLGKGMRSLLLPFLLIGMVVPSAAQLWTSACRVFPTDNIWNTPINKVPVHPRSSAYVNTIGADLSLRNDFGSGLWNGAPIGISYNIVGSSTPRSSVVFDYTDESDIVGYPIPQAPLIEGGDSGTGDRHVLMLDTSECKLYELYHVYNRNNVWTAGSGAVFDLTSNTLRPDTWTSADAAGLPILPGLVRYEEVAGGEIGHMIRFTVPKTSRAYLWPARHYASSITDPAYPPMGLVMRLKSTFDTSKLKPQARVIARALMTYGMILADNGSAWYMSGVPDERWDMDDLFTLRQIKGRDFDAVDISSLRIEPNSGKAKQAATGVEVNETNHTLVSLSGRYIDIDLCGVASVTGPVQVHCYDLVGSEQMLTPAESSPEHVRLDGSHLTPGVYIIVVADHAAAVSVW